VVWGALHGSYLATNHAWRDIAKWRGWRLDPSPLGDLAAQFLTFFLVVLAWVPFRADNLTTTVRVWRGMFGLNGIILPDSFAWVARSLPLLKDHPSLVRFVPTQSYIPTYATDWGVALVALILFCWITPNSTQLVIERRFPQWIAQRLPLWESAYGTGLAAVTLGLALGYCIGTIGAPSEFLYFRF
jgi:alginate O-acetyltransferase complex protein AlgI